MMRDSKGSPLREGAPVKLLRAAPELLKGLPEEDQNAIRWAAREVNMTFVGGDDYGNVELEFSDPSGCRHWIFVQPTDVAAV